MVIKLHLAEQWEPQDYLAAISAVERVYYISLFHAQFDEFVGFQSQRRRMASRFGWPFDGWLPEFIYTCRALADDEQRLLVSRISHASPGFIEIKGLGKAAQAVDSALGRIIAIFTERRLRRERDEQEAVKTATLRENLNSLKIENARKLLELDRDFPGAFHRQQLELALVEEQEKIENLAARGLLTDQRDHTDEK
jgi:hypothetical protein